MSFRGKRELLVQVAPRHSNARHGQRSVILDEFVAVTGYDRKYAIRLLLGPIWVWVNATRPPTEDVVTPALVAAPAAVSPPTVSTRKWSPVSGEFARSPAVYPVPLYPADNRLFRIVSG